MTDKLEYIKQLDADRKADAQYLNTAAGKGFMKRRIIPAFSQEIDAESDFLRGVQEGERKLAREIIEISNIGKVTND